MSTPIRLAVRPVSPIALTHSAPVPLRLTRLSQAAPLLRLAGVMVIDVSGNSDTIEFIADHDGEHIVAVGSVTARLLINGLLAAKSEFSVTAGSLHIPPELGVMAGDTITILPS